MFKLSTQQQGKAFIELVFVLPFLLWTGFGTVEAIKDSRYRQHMSTAAREIARGSFPRCLINNADPAQRSTEVRACFSTVVENVLPASGGGALDGATAIVSLWEFAGTGVDARLISRLNSGSNTTRYNPARVQTFHSYTAEKGLIITVEIFYSQQPLVNWFSGSYYETTII